MHYSLWVTRPAVVLTCALRWPDGVLLFLSEYQSLEIGAAPPELVGRPCALCSVPFETETHLYRCSCGVGLHAEGAESGKPQVDLLECALLSVECPSCQQPLPTQSGFSFVPET